METLEETPTMSPEQRADLDYAVHLATTGERDPEFEARIRSESDRITAEIRKQHGLLNVAMPTIRAFRIDDGDEA